MSKADLDLSEADMLNLAEMSAMVLSMLGQAMPDSDAPKAPAWQRLCISILKSARKLPSIARHMELNPDCGYWFFKRPYVENAFYSDVLDEYRDAAFWEELVARLANRSLVEYYGQDAVESMSPDERASHAAAMEKSLWNEVTRYGVDRLLFMLAPEDS